MARHELTDAQFAVIESLLPTGTRRGRPWKNHRHVVNGVFWQLNTGVPWRDIPERCQCQRDLGSCGFLMITMVSGVTVVTNPISRVHTVGA